MTMKLTASLVLYKSKNEQFEVAMRGFLAVPAEVKLYVVDNSPEPLMSELFNDPRVEYIYNGANVGFGAAHNVAIKLACPSSDFHLILNPDIGFAPATLTILMEEFERTSNLVVAMPRVAYPDGSLQRLCKLLPTPVDLLVRRFVPFYFIRAKLDKRYELHDLPQERRSEVPTLSGCFLLVRSGALLDVGGFDERFFMYMEDVDLVRRLADIGRAIYFPQVSVVHGYAKGSYRNYRLLFYHIRSAIKYFNKWGWLFDRERQRRNHAVLATLRVQDGL
jgi:GT2 family glycosyltransferase